LPGSQREECPRGRNVAPWEQQPDPHVAFTRFTHAFYTAFVISAATSEEAKMELEHDDLEGGVRMIRLKGRLDLEGSEAVDLRLTSLVALRKGFVIVDLAGVEFLSSIGVSVIVRVARALMSREGRLVLLGPRPNVADVLARTQIDQIIPVFGDLAAARTAVLSAG